MQMRSKNYIVITFGSTSGLRDKNLVRIMLESYVRLTLGSYVIKSCKWNQKVYVWKLRQNYVSQIMLELRQEVTLDLRQETR